MTIVAAFKGFAANVVAVAFSAATQERAAALAFVHEAWVAPFSAFAAQGLVSVTPENGFIMSQVHKAVVDNVGEFEQRTTVWLDSTAGTLFDWSMKRGAALSAWLKRGSE